jgi:spore coat protein U-like protein
MRSRACQVWLSNFPGRLILPLLFPSDSKSEKRQFKNLNSIIEFGASFSMKNTFKFPAIIAAVGVLTLGLASTAANAATATSPMQVTATVQATCLISTNNLSFGTYSGAQLDATSNVTVTCTNTTPYNVGLNAGTATGATVTTRQMLNGTIALNYALFSDAARTTNWGNTVSSDTVTGTGNGAAQSITVYGRIAANQYVKPGGYADTITATVTY